ncbi:iron ABC transporter ATP-binding protein [Sporanaerobium hydrogeniformans]|uniref:Iron ABC transporter ATP-binding protein n=1 Tax=Sporanaerobium hydrogeniformans TaxID=3072179 RepID=A0AC61DES7_9FIRM|nr:ABC transporter ATP-binding protein [Sporanaerobium hydrogeniformans]PHV71395.1 iron ABC transporter ATP-binding protein [Sporanaerobium hydrogeniformans]
MSLYIKNIKLKRGSNVVIEDFSLHIKQGELVAVLGLNGIGKTTLIKAIAGLLPVVQGDIFLNNTPISKMKPKERAQNLAYMPQQMAYDLSYTVSDFILMGITPYLDFWQTPRRSDDEEVEKVLNALNLSYLKASRLSQISGGERQMVYLARALMQKASVMLLDEPTAYLDFKRQHEFLHTLKKVKEQANKAILIAIHDPNLALQYADRIVILHHKQMLGVVCLTEEGDKDRKEAKRVLIKLLKKAYGEEVEFNQDIESSILYRQK